MKKHTVSRLKGLKDHFVYRGVTFYIRENVSAGYFGRYVIGSMSFTYRWEVIEYIDAKFDNKESQDG